MKTMKTRESGVVLVAAIILTSLACILAGGVLTVSSSAVVSAAKTIRFEKAFSIVEAGAERTKAELRTTSRSINAILVDGRLTNLDELVSFGGGTYAVRVTDNADSDASLFVDTDNTVIIRATGIYENVKRVLELTVCVSNPVAPPASSDGALAIYGTNTDVDVAGSAIIDGRDYTVPTNFNCTGSACDGTLTTNPAQPGMFSATNDTDTTVSGSAQVIGNPPVTNNAPADYNKQYWEDLANTLIPYATITLTGGNVNDVTLGTRDNPEITVITGNTQIAGGSRGAGILIIMSGVDLRFAGTFHYEGLVIILGDSVDFDQLGNASIFGALVSLGAGLDMRVQGSPEIKYSTAALANLANLQLPPRELFVQYWREIK